MDPLLNVVIRHQVYLEGLKAGRHLELGKTIVKLDRELRKQLAFVKFDNLSDMSRTAINKLVIDLKRTAMTVFDVWLKDLIRWLEEYTEVDEDFWKFTYRLSVPDKKAEIDEAPDAKKLFALAAALPMGANGILMLAFLKAYQLTVATKVGQAVFMAYVNGETKKQLIDKLVGSNNVAGAPGKDGKASPSTVEPGLLPQLQRQGKAVTNTVMQHLAAQVNAGVAAKAFPNYIWVSVLDDATTKICISRNGNVYVWGEGPVPPAHVGCRSSILAWDGNGPVPQMPGFKVWASAQSEAFIKDAFDGKPPSSYEGSSPLTLDEFKGKRALILG